VSRTLSPAQQALAERFLPLALRLARDAGQKWPALAADFESAVGLALCRAARDYEPERGLRFTTFARPQLIGALTDVKRAAVPLGYRVPGAVAPTLEPWGDNHHERPDPEPHVGADLEALDSVEGWLRKLPRRHRAVMRLLYVHGKSQTEVAATLGHHKQHVSIVRREALAILRDSGRRTWD
jgi:RNA polymerase sigma factor (sigma-70 family)